jgi:hypothetical protein
MAAVVAEASAAVAEALADVAASLADAAALLAASAEASDFLLQAAIVRALTAAPAMSTERTIRDVFMIQNPC